MIEKRADIPSQNNQVLSGVLRIPNEEKQHSALIICHGFMETKDLDFIKEIAEVLSFNGFVTLRFDMIPECSSTDSGMSRLSIMNKHFELPTLTQQIQEVRDAITFLETIPQVDKEKIGLIGHDLGGNAGLLLNDKRVKGIATIATRADLSRFFESYMDNHEIKEFLKRGFHDFGKLIVRDNVYYDLKNHDTIHAVQQQFIPLLFFHGTNDKRNPFEDARTLYHYAPNPVVEFIEEADHNFTFPDHRQFLMETVRNFFLKVFMARRLER